jgi:hypothetical protein
MTDKSKHDNSSTEKATVTLAGKVEKIIPSLAPDDLERAQIAVEGSDLLYREIRIKNELNDSAGNTVQLKKGSDVEVTIAAEPEARLPET